MTASETTGLIGSNYNNAKEITYHLESVRAIGLTMAIVMLLVGQFITNRWVWGRDGNPDSVEDTYIYQLFGFAHTCVDIDFNPSRTVAAILIIFLTLPLQIFTYLNHQRIVVAHNSGEITDGLLKFSTYTWKLRFVCFTYFFMVFVNPPDKPYTGPYGTVDQMLSDPGWRAYFKHYIFFMFYHIGLALQAFEQTCFNYQMNTIPFSNIITRTIQKYYIIAIGTIFLYYHMYIWAFMFEFPFPGKDNTPLAEAIMKVFLGLSTVIPAVMAYCQWKGIGGVVPIESRIKFY